MSMSTFDYTMHHVILSSVSIQGIHRAETCDIFRSTVSMYWADDFLTVSRRLAQITSETVLRILLFSSVGMPFFTPLSGIPVE